MKFSSVLKTILKLPKLYTIGGAAVLIVGGTLGVHALTRSAPATTDVAAGISHVHLASVASLSGASGPLPVTGKVTSESQATILAQTAGEIVALSHAIGDHVFAGAVIATFENSSQQAAVLQAQGAYDAAEAAYEKAQSTSAQNSAFTSGAATQNAQSAATSALAALSSAYASLDDAVHVKADQLFTNPRGQSPQVALTVPDGNLVSTLQTERAQIETTLQNARVLASTTGTATIDANIGTMITYAQSTSAFLNDLIQAVNETPASQSTSAATLAGYQTSLAAGRTEATGAVSALTAAKSAYDTAVTTANTSANSAGASVGTDLASAAANVKQAQGALNGAKAALEKTIVRSPIGGTIVSLPITQGGYVSSFAQVAVVSNPGALYVDAYVTASDAKTIAVGNAVTIGDTSKGIITFIAPAIDPTTNKIEVKVGITGDQSTLTDGEIVTLTLARTQTSTAPKTTAVAQDLTIPIVAAKITPTGSIVFTVSTTSTLVAHPLTLGTILGDRVTVVSGLTSEVAIVTNARGLAEGQTVIVDPN